MALDACTLRRLALVRRAHHVGVGRLLASGARRGCVRRRCDVVRTPTSPRCCPPASAPKWSTGGARSLVAAIPLADIAVVERHRQANELDRPPRRRHPGLEARTAAAVMASGTTSTEVFGVDPIVAAVLIGCSGDPTRFATASRYVAETGTAAIQLSSKGWITAVYDVQSPDDLIPPMGPRSSITYSRRRCASRIASSVWMRLAGATIAARRRRRRLGTSAARRSDVDEGNRGVGAQEVSYDRAVPVSVSASWWSSCTVGPLAVDAAEVCSRGRARPHTRPPPQAGAIRTGLDLAVVKDALPWQRGRSERVKRTVRRVRRAAHLRRNHA